MSDLFNAIVRLFNTISDAIGLPYHELNILIYTFLIPATWWLIVWLRMRRMLGMALVHMTLPLFHYVQTAPHSQRFYNATVSALSYLGGGTEAGYVQVSLIVGLLFPLLIYFALLAMPKKWLIQLYFGLLFANMAWYVWALTRF